MGGYDLGKLNFNPAKNPAVLDTLTWEPEALLRTISAQPEGFWVKAAGAASNSPPQAGPQSLRLHEKSIALTEGGSYALMESEDGQHVIAEFARRGGETGAVKPLLRKRISDDVILFLYEASSENLHRIYGKAAPVKLPQAMPATPRLGIGTRMSKASWPGIWRFLNESAYRANTIQNSRRELNLLEDVLGGNIGRQLYYPGIGFVPEGHSGSTFEGLWLCGVCEGLKAGTTAPYGADADHIMVKRGPDGLDKAKRVLNAAPYYSFFTIDVSDILDYAALLPGGKGNSGTELLERNISDEKIRKDVITYYKNPIEGSSGLLKLTEPEVAGLVGKYWRALEAIARLIPFIDSMRGDEPFDLELSIDEHPPEIHPFDCLTTEVEVAFILEEMKRRGCRLTHIAPNLGVEKHVDYRYMDGLEGLETRTRALHRIANREGVVIDCHSGDDLSADTRRALRRATGGMIHFKISPYLQVLFADVVYDFDPGFFRIWWDDTFNFVKANAREGSALAAEFLKEYETDANAKPHPKYALFRLYCYATVGKRDEEGNYLYRERFYSLRPDFYNEYSVRVKSYLDQLAQDLL